MGYIPTPWVLHLFVGLQACLLGCWLVWLCKSFGCSVGAHLQVILLGRKSWHYHFHSFTWLPLCLHVHRSNLDPFGLDTTRTSKNSFAMRGCSSFRMEEVSGTSEWARRQETSAAGGCRRIRQSFIQCAEFIRILFTSTLVVEMCRGHMFTAQKPTGGPAALAETSQSHRSRWRTLASTTWRWPAISEVSSASVRH